jgi:hypothetical protein
VRNDAGGAKPKLEPETGISNWIGFRILKFDLGLEFQISISFSGLKTFSSYAIISPEGGEAHDR